MIRQVVAQHLRPSAKERRIRGLTTMKVSTFVPALPVGALAASLSRVGLDLYGGECVLGALHRVDWVQGTEVRALAITTRRTIVGGYATSPTRLNELGFALEHDEILGVEADYPTLQARLKLLTAHGACPLSAFYDMCGELQHVYQGLVAYPAGSRAEPRTSPISPTTDDPSGALGALAQLWVQDASAHPMLTAIDAKARSGALPIDDATDLAARTVLWHRARLCGAASYGPANLSPLRADDFASVVTLLLGSPLGYQQPQPDLYAMDFRVLPSHELSPGMVLTQEYPGGLEFGVGRALLSAVIPKPELQTLRVVFGDVQGGTRYELFANELTPLAAAEGLTAHHVHQRLIARTEAVLARRIEVGWSRPTAELWA